jgi:peptidoglycan/LPS O-acetylase OafA/YrhL
VKPVPDLGPRQRQPLSVPSHLPSVQSARGVAAILVLLFHVTEQAAAKLNIEFLGGAFRHGWAGLDLFFVLSGFIICHIHHEDFGHPERSRDYLLKRLIRIFPLYWVILSGTILIAFLLPQFASDRERSLDCILRSWFLIPQRGLPVLGVAWTLCHEIYFYLVFAVAILVRGRWVPWLAATWILSSAGYAFAHPDLLWPSSLSTTSPPLWQLFPLSHFNIEFALGIGVALGFRRLAERGGMATGLAWGLIGGGILLYVCGPALRSALESILPPNLCRVTVYGTAAACVVLGGVGRDLMSPPGWFNRLLAPLGDASYSIYLVHYPLLVALIAVSRSFITSKPFLITPALLTLSGLVLVVGWLVHRLVERPLLKYGRAALLTRRTSPAGPIAVRSGT